LRRLENENYLRWLMVTRVAVTATLLFAAMSIEVIFAPGVSLLPLYVLCAGTFVLVITYAVVYRVLGRSPWFVALQLGGDLVVVTGFVFVTGGVASPMTFLYFLPIITASVLTLRRGALATAAGASLLYAALGGARLLTFVPLRPEVLDLSSDVDYRHLLYSVMSHVAGFFLAAIFSSVLSEKIRIADIELAEKRSDLAELQALNENIVESINSGLVTTDLDGRITFVNPGACAITGYDKNALVGRCANDVFGFEKAFLSKIHRMLGIERRFRFEKPFQTPSGGERFLGIAVSVLKDRAKNALGFIFIFQDLTEINALERQVRLKDRMAALGEMAAGMAHELRNPLASISGSVQVLRSELRPSADQLELMDIILRESQRLDQTIREFLVFAKPGHFSPERTDVVRLLQDAAKLLRNSSQFRSGCEVEIVSSSPEIWCEVDVNRIKQVFWNLATNAVKAMPSGGALRIEVSGRAESLEIVFRDDGIGMSEEEIERYFQPFRGNFREGTGLGAAIVYRIVEEHGGTVTVRSRPAEGTEVRVSLPAADLSWRDSAGSMARDAAASALG